MRLKAGLQEDIYGKFQCHESLAVELEITGTDTSTLQTKRFKERDIQSENSSSSLQSVEQIPVNSVGDYVNYVK